MGLLHHHHEKEQQQQQMQQQGYNPNMQQQYNPNMQQQQPQQFGLQPGQGQQPYVYQSAQQPQQQQPVQNMTPQEKEHHLGAGLGGKFANAVVWGAGATLGADAANAAFNAFKN